jgi:hypothetical protein
MAVVERAGVEARRLDRSRLDAWIRVVAGARLAEGFEGEHATFLASVASGDARVTGRG